MRKFWNWVRNENEERTLIIDGVIAEDSWFGDEVTPKAFKDELLSSTGDITVSINSVGGDCIAAAQIYNMLMDYKNDVTIKIDGIAASAASVIAMAGTKVLMSPTSLMMVHNPWIFTMGDSLELKKTISMLDEVKESIMNAYELKTNLSRRELSTLMDNETWMNANKALELGFADEMLYKNDDPTIATNSYAFSRMSINNAILNKLPKQEKKIEMLPIDNLDKRLNLLK